MEARPFGPPTLDQGCILATVVMHDEMDIEFGRNSGVDRIEELPEFDGAVTAVAFADHATGFGVNCCE